MNNTETREFNIEFKSQIGLLDHLPGMHYIFIPDKIVRKTGGTLSRRVIITVNKKVSWQGGYMSLRDGHAYISISKKRLSDAGAALNDEVHVQLRPDHSKYGMEMTKELETVLNQDAEGLMRFEALRPGMQRYIIQYAGAVKSSEKRIERALRMIDNLKKIATGKEQFRQILGLDG